MPDSNTLAYFILMLTCPYGELFDSYQGATYCVNINTGTVSVSAFRYQLGEQLFGYQSLPIDGNGAAQWAEWIQFTCGSPLSDATLASGIGVNCSIIDEIMTQEEAIKNRRYLMK